MNKTGLLAICLIAFFVFKLSGAGLPAETSPELKLLSQNSSEIVLAFRGTGFYTEPVNTDEGLFVRLYFGNSYPCGDIGSPELPVTRALVQIPFGAEPKIRMVEEETDEYLLSDLGIGLRIIPRQPPMLKKQGWFSPFELDESVYSRDSYLFEDRVKIIDVTIARAYRLALIEIRPVDYNPVRETVSVLKSLRFAIELPGADLAETRRIKKRYGNGPYDMALKPSIINPHAFENAEKWLPATGELGYLIVSGDAYADTARLLADWKTSKGYSVKLRTVGELGGTANSIRDWIVAEYDTAAIVPTFVLLIGDIDEVPSFDGEDSGSETDTPFGEMDGSGYIPELFIGRISPENSHQLGHFIRRIIDYEHFAFDEVHRDFADKAAFLASDDASFWEIAEGTHRYAIQTYMGPRGFECDSIWAHSDPFAHTRTITAVNDGRVLVDYSGHGGYYLWDAPDMEQSDVEALTNTGEYPFVLSHACITGTFHLSECFGETWIRQYDKGAIAFLGASSSSYWNEDDEMERRMFDDIFNEDYYFLGGMVHRSLIAVYIAYPDNAHYYFDIYNLLGDPSLALWFRVPEALSAVHPESVIVGGDMTINISADGSPVDSVLICATNGGSVNEVGYTDAAGNATLDLTEADMGDTIRITATAYNKIPYEGFTLVTGTGPWLIIENVVIDDSLGDNDGVVDIGEEIELTITLKNTGVEDALAVNGILRAVGASVTMLDSVKFYGDIVPWATRTNSTPFVAEIGSDLADGGLVTFILFAVDAADSMWDVIITEPVAAPILSYSDYEIDDVSGGDGDGYPESGESIDLTVEMNNTGGETARFMYLELSAADPYISVVSSASGIDSIPTSDSRPNSPAFRLDIDPSCPSSYSVDLVISATDFRGPSCIDTFSLVIGEAGFTEDCESGPGLWYPDLNWHITGRRYASPSNSWYSGNEWTYMYPDTSYLELVTPEIVVPVNPVFGFWHFCWMEDGYDSCYVDYSTDGGISWHELGGFSGPANRWHFARFDLSSRDIEPGSPILFMFSQYADYYVHGEGWYIDDIELARAREAYLGAGSVEPFAGNTATEFRFVATYCSPDDYLPSSAYVVLDGSEYAMAFSGEGSVPTGAIYEYNSNLPIGPHSYHYEFTVGSDTLRFPEDGEIDGPFVSAPFYEFDIGNSPSGLMHYGPRDDWEYGVPSTGPDGVPVGTQCWATQIDGEYRDSSRSRLVLPEMDLTDIEKPFLCFYHWYRFQGAEGVVFHDGSNVKISVDGGLDTFIVHPQGGYDGTASQYNHFVDWEPVFGDNDIGNLWQFEAIDLSPWFGHTVTVSFDFGSSSRNTEAGWYINNIYLLGAEAGGITDNIAGKPDKLSICASPNPFNSSVKLHLNIPEKTATLKIFDISGRRVADLSDKLEIGVTDIIWDAVSLPSGIYFAKLGAGERSVSETLIMVK